MSILSSQNILGGDSSNNAQADRSQTSFAQYSFGPSMSKRSSPESTETGKFLYNSPTRSFAPESAMQSALGQGNFGEGIGVDGRPIRKGDTDTTYGPNANANGVVSKMSSSDSSLLTGIARVLAGITSATPTYHAIDYFTTRTPKATRSYRNAQDLGGNKGGSGTERKYFTAARKYPAEILTTGEGAEYVPALPLEHQGTGLFNLIPRTAGDEDISSDNYEQVNQEVNGQQAAAASADQAGADEDIDSTVVVSPGGTTMPDDGNGVLNNSSEGASYVDPNLTRWSTTSSAGGGGSAYVAQQRGG